MFSGILFLALIPSVVFTSNLERRKEIRQGVSVSWLNMRRYSNRILNITAIASFSTTTKEKCGSLCLSTSTCKSLNLKEESPSQYQCELLDQNMFEANCAFLWDEVTSHFAFVSNCTNDYNICNDPHKICVPNDRVNTYTCQQKQDIQLDQKSFCPLGTYDLQVYNVNWRFPYCALCRGNDGSIMILSNSQLSGNRTWKEYRNGFGKINKNGHFWIGLEILHQQTNPPVFLSFFIVDATNRKYKVKLHNFTVSSELDFYKMHVASQGGENNFVDYHSGKPFSTFDHGINTEKAKLFGSGWWYGDSEGMNWFTRHDKDLSGFITQRRLKVINVRISRYVNT